MPVLWKHYGYLTIGIPTLLYNCLFRKFLFFLLFGKSKISEKFVFASQNTLGVFSLVLYLNCPWLTSVCVNSKCYSIKSLIRFLMPLLDYIMACILRFTTGSCSIWDWLPIDSYIFAKMQRQISSIKISYHIQVKKPYFKSPLWC